MSQHRHTVTVSGKSVYSSTVTVPDPNLAPYLQTANLEAALKASPTIAALKAQLGADEVTIARLLTLVAGSGSTVTPPPATGWDAKPPFMSYASHAARNIVGAHDVEISGESYDGTAFPNAAIRLEDCVNVYIHDVDFRNLEWDAIDVLSCSGTFRLEWARYDTLGLVDHTSPGDRFGADFVQFDHSAVSGYIANVKGKNGRTEDIISFVNESGGTGPSDLFEVYNHHFQGSNWTSTSGSGGMLADNSTTGGHIWYHDGTLLNPGQVGCAISMGVDCHVTNMVIYGAQRANSNVGIYTPYTAGSPNPGGHEVAHNRVWWKNAAGTLNSFFNGGASGTISGLATNTWDDTTIDPATLAVTL